MESREIGLSSICFGWSLGETFPSLPTSRYLQRATTALSLSLVHPCSHPIMEARRTKPLLLHVIQSFPLRCRNAGLDVSIVLNKAAACTKPAGGDPAMCIALLMEWANMLRSSMDRD